MHKHLMLPHGLFVYIICNWLNTPGRNFSNKMYHFMNTFEIYNVIEFVEKWVAIWFFLTNVYALASSRLCPFRFLYLIHFQLTGCVSNCLPSTLRWLYIVRVGLQWARHQQRPSLVGGRNRIQSSDWLLVLWTVSIDKEPTLLMELDGVCTHTDQYAVQGHGYAWLSRQIDHWRPGGLTLPTVASWQRTEAQLINPTLQQVGRHAVYVWFAII